MDAIVAARNTALAGVVSAGEKPVKPTPLAKPVAPAKTPKPSKSPKVVTPSPTATA